MPLNTKFQRSVLTGLEMNNWAQPRWLTLAPVHPRGRRGESGSHQGTWLPHGQAKLEKRVGGVCPDPVACTFQSRVDILVVLFTSTENELLFSVRQASL